MGGRGSELEDWLGVYERVAAVERSRGRSPRLGPVFEPALTFEQIEEVEAEAGISLPDEYAAFLAEVGSGGPGPDLELTTLCQVDGRWAWVWTAANYPQIPDASGPFLENDEWVGHQIATLRAAGGEPTVRDSHSDYLGDYRRVFGEVEGTRLFAEGRFRGAIQISDNGCGMTSWLVLEGPHRGEIWFRDCAPNPPLEPLLNEAGEPHGFYSWYIDWLERREEEYGLRQGEPGW